MVTLIVTDLKTNEEILIKGPKYLDYLSSLGLDIKKLLKDGNYTFDQFLVETVPNTFINHQKRNFMEI